MTDRSSDAGFDRPVRPQTAPHAQVRTTLLTPAGRGALAVVGMAGAGAAELVARLFSPRGGTPLAGRPAGAIVFGRWGETAAGAGEDLVVVCRSDDDLEIHCHGGLAASEAVISSLEGLGAVRQSWPEWLRAGGMAEIEVEAREALATAGGPKAARILARQLTGLLQAELERVRRLMQDGHLALARAALDRLARGSRVGLRLVRPWRVVLAGSVNAGKSSLANALVGYARSIVSPEPGTTRDLLQTRIVINGWEVDLVDTAGLRDAAAGAGGDAASAVEREGMVRAVAACADADLVLRVVDGREAIAAGRLAPEAPGELLVYSKADLTERGRGSALGRGSAPDGPPWLSSSSSLWTSVVSGEGIEKLAAGIVRRLVSEEVDEPDLLSGPVPFTPRQVAAVAALDAECASLSEAVGFQPGCCREADSAS
jgi:tRNA modification GTPase